jgi:hypothetical protein
MLVESKLCKDCRPKRKSVTKLSAKEIHNKVQSGDMSEYMAKMLRAKLARDERNKQGMASRKRWAKKWQAELREILTPITKEIISARNACKYARDRGFVDKAEFYFEYHALLHHEKAHAEVNYAIKPRRPTSARWEDYVGSAVFTRVREMWATLPPIYKHTGKVPMLIKYRPEDSKNAE